MSEKKVCVFQEVGTCFFAIRSTKNPKTLASKLNRYNPRGVVLVGSIDDTEEDLHLAQIYSRYEKQCVNSWWFNLSLDQVFDILGIEFSVNRKKEVEDPEADTFADMMRLMEPEMKDKGFMKASDLYARYHALCKIEEISPRIAYSENHFFRALGKSDRFMKKRMSDGQYYLMIPE